MTGGLRCSPSEGGRFRGTVCPRVGNSSARSSKDMGAQEPAFKSICSASYQLCDPGQVISPALSPILYF